MHARLPLLSLLVALLLTVNGRAGAAEAEDGCLNDDVCRGHYETAIQQFEGGRYDSALSGFQAAYAQRQMPWLLVNIGRTLHRLGRLKEAITYYERYQQSGTGTDPATNQKVEGYLAQARLLLKGNAQTATDAAIGSGQNSAPPSDSVPRYKKWWFWTAIGGGVVAVTLIGVGIGVGVANSGGGMQSMPTPMPMSMPSVLPGGIPVYRPSF